MKKQNAAPKTILNFNQKHLLLLPPTSILSRSTMAYNTTNSLNKLSCTNYVDFGESHNDLDNFLSLKGMQILECKSESFQEKSQRRLHTGTKSYNGRGRLQPVHAIEESTGHCSRKLWWGEKFVSSADTNIVQNVNEQLKVAHKLLNVVNRANRKICVTLLT